MTHPGVSGVVRQKAGGINCHLVPHSMTLPKVKLSLNYGAWTTVAIREAVVGAALLLTKLTKLLNTVTCPSPDFTSRITYQNALKTIQIRGLQIPDNTAYALGNAHIRNGVQINDHTVLATAQVTIGNGVRTRGTTEMAIDARSLIGNGVRVGRSRATIVGGAHVVKSLRFRRGAHPLRTRHGAVNNGLRTFGGQNKLQVVDGHVSNGLRYGRGIPTPANGNGFIQNGGRSRYTHF